jgi:hypothetical protein
MYLKIGNSLPNLGTSSAVTIYSMYLRLNLSTTPDLKFYVAVTLYSTVLDPITGNFEAD